VFYPGSLLALAPPVCYSAWVLKRGESEQVKRTRTCCGLRWKGATRNHESSRRWEPAGWIFFTIVSISTLCGYSVRWVCYWFI